MYTICGGGRCRCAVGAGFKPARIIRPHYLSALFAQIIIQIICPHHYPPHFCPHHLYFTPHHINKITNIYVEIFIFCNLSLILQ